MAIGGYVIYVALWVKAILLQSTVPEWCTTVAAMTMCSHAATTCLVKHDDTSNDVGGPLSLWTQPRAFRSASAKGQGFSGRRKGAKKPTRLCRQSQEAMSQETGFVIIR